jgi:signal transduction histidine kinase
LYITRQIVESHGGTIRAQSTPGDGATFEVRLPGVEAAGATAPADGAERA